MRKFKYSLLGGAIAFVIAVLTLDQAFPGLDPSIWRAYAGVVGLGATPAVTPVIWGRLVNLGFAPTQISMVAVGALAFAVFEIFWRMLTILVCPSKDNPNWWRLTVPAVSMLASFLAVFSGPVWRLTLSGSPDLLTLTLFLLAFDCFLMSFFTVVIYDYDGTPIGAFHQNLGRCAAILLFGMLLVETPVALVLPALFVFVYRLINRRVAAELYDDHPSDLLVFVPLRIPTAIVLALGLAGLAVAVVLSGVLGRDGGVMRYLGGTVRGVLDAATPLGWVQWACCALVPFALGCRWLPVLTGKNARLRPVVCVAAILIGAVPLAAVSPFVRGGLAPFASAAVRLPFMQALGAVLAAMAVAQALALLAYFAFHVRMRNFASHQLLAFVVCIMLAAALAVAGAGVRRGQARQVRQVISDAMDETVREARGLSWIFTDGSVDVGIELEARQRGQGLRVRPLVASEGALQQLTEWVSCDSSNLQACAVQGGFELWERAGRQPPPASGLLARANWPANAREYGIVFADRLQARMQELTKAGAVAREDDPCVRAAFAAVLEQLSRMSRQRAAAR